MQIELPNLYQSSIQQVVWTVCVRPDENMQNPPSILVAKRVVGGGYTFPGGKVEIDESYNDAARREFRQETGLELLLAMSAVDESETILLPNGHFIKANPFIVYDLNRILNPINTEPNKHLDWEWLPLDVIKFLIAEGLLPFRSLTYSMLEEMSKFLNRYYLKIEAKNSLETGIKEVCPAWFLAIDIEIAADNRAEQFLKMLLNC